MPRSAEQVRWDFVQEWLRKAEADRFAAEVLLGVNQTDYYAVAFHAQQAAEKWLKAFLVRYQIPFPKTHDIGYLLKLAAQADAALPQELADAELLTPFGVDFRYPGAEIVDRAMAAQAVAWATMVKDAVLARLQSYLAAGRPQ